jgi:hypothetical protein
VEKLENQIFLWEEQGHKIMSVRLYSSGCHQKKGRIEFKKGNAIRPHIILLNKGQQ